MNTSGDDELFEILLDMWCGICLMMEGGWFDLEFTYRGSLLGLLKGLYDPSLRLMVMSRKSTLFWLHITSIFKLCCWKRDINFCLVCSMSRPDAFSMTPSPSSRYNPTF